MTGMDTEVKEPCCDLWDSAHKEGTDSEGYGPLVDYYVCGSPRLGYEDNLAADNRQFIVRFCPFCGAEKGK